MKIRHGDGRRIAAMRARFTRLAASLLLAVLAICPAMKSQQQQAPSPMEPPPQRHQQNEQDFQTAPLSDLALENLNYIAASAQQIEDVLRSQPGLLVELEHWIARDATDHGQMVDEQGMSQDGIFDRLERDRKFRAVATRLLQRYGYLKPEVNPDSQLGKQQQLEFLAKQRRLQQPPARAAREEPPTFYPVPIPTYPSNIQSPPRAPRRQRTQPIPPPPQLGPAPATPQNPYTNGLMASADFPARSATDPEGKLSRAQMEQELRERGVESPAPPGGTLVRPWQNSPYSRQAGNGYEEKSSRPEIVHRANPYSSIPSLYDLYEQVSPHSPELQRFGTEVFENAPADITELPMDLPAGPNYVVGPGDGLAISLWGSVAERLYRVVDREGRLALPEVGPVMVSGETMGAVQQRVQEVLRTQFRDVSADVSLARLRTVRVYVVGEVKYPGAYDISSLSTPLNALFAAGGPASDGSLRLVQHFRGKKLIQNVDLYDLLLHGVRSDLERLENGDTILVPPVGSEVKVEGMVRRPAIYELHGEK
ncbi:MAG TPA: polysaccharide biosynthesis/export family protein, partial [Terriglobia bacterium]|nr:polysaccharide biosynthesis/export family protein [Terriglobia bacterium]